MLGGNVRIGISDYASLTFETAFTIYKSVLVACIQVNVK